MSSSSLRLFIPSKMFFLTLTGLVLTTVCMAQEKAELYGGYSYFRASIEEVQPSGTIGVARISENTNLNGWEFSGQYKFLPFLGAAADFSGNYGTLHNANTREHTFLFGPQISLPGKVSPFAHALFGAATESQDPIALPPVPCPTGIVICGVSSLGTDTSFASAVGAGIDLKVAPFIKLRLFQVDYLRTQMHGATQNQPRVSAGIVVHL